MPNTSIAPCLACGVHTGNAHLLCSDACFEQYANDNQDIFDADMLSDMAYADEQFYSEQEINDIPW